jgi:dihydrolipoamide dehydrogenase
MTGVNMVMGSLREKTQLVVIGGGPGGYVAAIRAADLGLDVMLVEEKERLGGVCLLEGCIPSKAMINAVELANSAREAGKLGLTFKELTIDPKVLRQWTDSVVDTLSKGVSGLLKKRGVEVIKGRARFQSNKGLAIEGGEVSGIDFDNCIIATGSRINELPSGYNLPLWSSAEALKLTEIPQTLLVVGGGYIGLEMGLVYSGLGSKVTIAEFSPRLLMGADADLVEVMVKHCEKKFEKVMYESKVTAVEKSSSGFSVTIDHKGEISKLEFNQVLVAIGRKPNTENIGLENTKIKPMKNGLIEVDKHGRTAEPNIFAIGDVVPGPALAHKASREGKVAAEVIAKHNAELDNRAIPAVVFTDPEIAWVGLTERDAEVKNIKLNIGKFPLTALGRARAIGRTEGFVKILSEPDTNLVLGVGIVGPQASELISESTLAIEMGATLEDLMVTIHPHPTLSESIMEAAEVAAGSPVHINPVKK